MSDFANLKLSPELLGYLQQAGYREPTALQVEAIPVIARGTTVAGAASAGSGKTLAYGLGLATRLDAATSTHQALILRPTDDLAANTADSLNRLLRICGLKVALVQPELRVAAHVSVASPDAALSALEHSAIKLDQLDALVVDGLSAMMELGAGVALETLTAQIPKDAQRIVLSGALTPEVKDWIDRHARRARQLAYLPAEAQPLVAANLEFYASPRRTWLVVLVSRMRGLSGPRGSGSLVIRCRSASEAEELGHQLAVRGFVISADAQRPRLRIECGDASEIEPDDSVISWGVPADFASFRNRVIGPANTLILAEPRELPHLGRLAELAEARMTALKTAIPPEALRSAQLTRDRLREALTTQDIEPYLLLLQPLLEEFTPSEVAAAATALVRERIPATAPTPLPAWTRLYFGVGRRDNIRPADLVGAITGESSVSGDQIGRIDIRDTHCAVEIAAPVADQVIKALASTTIRGRPANVRVFRE